MTIQRKLTAAVCVLICTILFCKWLDGYNGILFFVFQARDLHRALEILDGKSFFFGPEMTGGGNLPGPLYYYLLALPLAYHPSWVSAWYLLGAMILLGGAFGFLYMRKQFSWIMALLWLGLFILSPNTRRFLMIFLNVSYMLPLTVAAQIFIALGFTAQSSRARSASLLAACFVIGLGLQFHFSIFILFLALLFLAASAPKLGLPAVDRRLSLPAAALLVGPSLPYLTWQTCRSLGIHFGQPAEYIGNAEFALPSLLLLVKMASGIPLREFLFHAFHHCLEAIPHIVFVLLFLRIVMRANPVAETPSERVMRQIFKACALFGLPLFLFWFCAPIGNRYVQPFYIALTFLAAVEIAAILRSRFHVKVFNICAGLVLLCSLAIFFLSAGRQELEQHFFEGLVVILLPSLTAYALSREFRKLGAGAAIAVALTFGVTHLQGLLMRSGQIFSGPNIMPRHWEWRRIWNAIYLNTGWNYSTAIHRVYFIGHHLEQDAYPGYETAVNRTAQRPTPQQIDGFIVAYLQPAREFKSPQETLAWVLTQNIQEDLKTALRQGDIALDNSLLSDMTVLPYRVVNPKSVPSLFHNTGEGYIRNSDEYLLDATAANEGVVSWSDSRVMFKWNECPEHHVYCSTGALVDYFQTEGRLRIKTRVVGQSISQVSPWIGPNWTQAWVEPYLEVACDGTIGKYPLASSIGYLRKYADDPTRPLLLGNNSMVAPFEREFDLPCKKLESITVGREASSIEAIYSGKMLPGKRLTFTL